MLFVLRSLAPGKSSFAQSANDWPRWPSHLTGLRIVVAWLVKQVRKYRMFAHWTRYWPGPSRDRGGPLSILVARQVAPSVFFADGQLKPSTLGWAGPVLCPRPKGAVGPGTGDGLIVFAPSPFANLFREPRQRLRR